MSSAHGITCRTMSEPKRALIFFKRWLKLHLFSLYDAFVLSLVYFLYSDWSHTSFKKKLGYPSLTWSSFFTVRLFFTRILMLLLIVLDLIIYYSTSVSYTLCFVKFVLLVFCVFFFLFVLISSLQGLSVIGVGVGSGRGGCCRAFGEWRGHTPDTPFPLCSGSLQISHVIKWDLAINTKANVRFNLVHFVVQKGKNSLVLTKAKYQEFLKTRKCLNDNVRGLQAMEYFGHQIFYSNLNFVIHCYGMH